MAWYGKRPQVSGKPLPSALKSMNTSDASRSQQKRIVIAAILAAIVTFIVYLPALQNDFVNWDDDVNVYQNVHLRRFDGAFLRWAFTDMTISYWQPVIWFSHALDYALWGLKPPGHHLTNILLHALNTFLVVLLAGMLLYRYGPSNETGPPGDRRFLIAATATGLLFGLHPLHVESVAWISERKDLLSTLFFLLSVLAYIRYASFRKGKGGATDIPFFRRRSYWFSLACFLLALASKPMTVTLPAVLLLLDWYPFRRLRTRNDAGPLIREKVPYLAMSLIISIATVLAHAREGMVRSLNDLPFLARVLAAAKATVLYLAKMTLPVGLSPYYPDPKEISLGSPAYGISVLLVIAITAAAFFAARRTRLFAAVWGYYIITLLPVLGLVKTAAVTEAERFTYLPSIAPFLLAGIGAAGIAAWMSKRSPSGYARAAALLAAGAAVFAPLVIKTERQIGVWKDGVVFWSTVIGQVPSEAPFVYESRAQAYVNAGRLNLAVADYSAAISLDKTQPNFYIGRGILWKTMGEIDRAIADHTTAIGLNPRLPDGYYHRGIDYWRAGQLDHARNDIDRAIEIDPTYVDAYVGRGLLSEQAGRPEDALKDYAKAIALDPQQIAAYVQRGRLLLERGETDRAEADFSAAIRMDPLLINAYVDRGSVFERAGRLEQAIGDYSAAIRMDPASPAAYINRGFVFERQGRYEQALEDLNRAIELDPSNADAYNNRGLVFESLGRFEQAIGDYDNAIEISPGDALGFNNRGIALRKLGRFEEALRDHTKALSLNPDFSAAYVDRGDCYRESGRSALALADYRRACDRGDEAGCEALRVYGGH